VRPTGGTPPSPGQGWARPAIWSIHRRKVVKWGPLKTFRRRSGLPEAKKWFAGDRQTKKWFAGVGSARPSRPSAAPPPRRAAAPRPPPPPRRRHARHQPHCRLLRRRHPRSRRHLRLRHLQPPPPPSPGSSTGGSRAHPALLAPCSLQRRPCALAAALIATGRVTRDAQQPLAAPAPARPHASSLFPCRSPDMSLLLFSGCGCGFNDRKGGGGSKAAKSRVAFCRIFRLRCSPRS
jgi:hypothetical protein